MKINDLLKKMVEMDASDLYLSTGAQPSVKVHGKLINLGGDPLCISTVKDIAYSMLPREKCVEFDNALEMNFALSRAGIGRFRVNLFVQRGEVAMVVRCIKTTLPSCESLGLPAQLKKIIMEKRGLVLFVGATSSGKSTSLAALINHRNEHDAGHIITIEDPIEFIHDHKKSIINQREVGIDTHSYEKALQNTLRQSPDVILIGEIRSRETMEHAIAFSETGHLCLSTLHANNANQAFDRIVNFFPEEKRMQVLMDLSFNVKAVISQRLIPGLNGKRVLAVEILLGTPLILSLIGKGAFDEIKEVIERSTQLGMQSFDQALEKLYFEKKISLEEALKNADSTNNLRLKIALKEKGEKGSSQNGPKNPPSEDNPLQLIDD